MNLFSIFIAILLAQTAFSTSVVSVGGKSYSIALQEFELKICPQDAPNGPEWGAIKFVAISGFSNSYNISVGKCKADCGQDNTCQHACVSDQSHVQKHKAFAMKVLFKYFRDFPPARQSMQCSAVHEFCEQKCLDENAFNAQECLIGCNQYHEIFDK